MMLQNPKNSAIFQNQQGYFEIYLKIAGLF